MFVMPAYIKPQKFRDAIMFTYIHSAHRSCLFIHWIKRAEDLMKLNRLRPRWRRWFFLISLLGLMSSVSAWAQYTTQWPQRFSAEVSVVNPSLNPALFSFPAQFRAQYGIVLYDTNNNNVIDTYPGDPNISFPSGSRIGSPFVAGGPSFPPLLWRRPGLRRRC